MVRPQCAKGVSFFARPCAKCTPYVGPYSFCKVLRQGRRCFHTRSLYIKTLCVEIDTPHAQKWSRAGPGHPCRSTRRSFVHLPCDGGVLAPVRSTLNSNGGALTLIAAPLCRLTDLTWCSHPCRSTLVIAIARAATNGGAA